MDRRSGVTRRTVLNAAGAGLGVSVLAACSDGTGGTAGSTTASSPAGGGTGPGAVSPGGGGHTLVALADVPVGGAVSATDASGGPVIVAQPEEGTVVAFSAICTHRGCTVAPQDGILECPCHGSTYDAATGENTGGPAPKPLPEIAVRVEDGSVVQA
jgi:Rieske Fe-S protein